MKNHWLITQTVVGLVVSLFCAHSTELPVPEPAGDELGYPTNELIALELGRADATRDLSQGVLRLPIYGSPIEWSSDFSRILEEKYNIDRYGLGGPLITPGLTEYARGYSEISDRAIKEKFGTNFFERVLAEAKQAYAQRMHAQAAVTSAAPVVVATPVVATPTPVAATPTPVAAATVRVVAQSVAPANRTYRVKPGDTFWEIARQHRVPVSSLVAANPGVTPGKLQINRTLNVPTATRP